LAELVNIFEGVEAAGLLLAALPRDAIHRQAFDLLDVLRPSQALRHIASF
jgi:hypothetical protein